MPKNHTWRLPATILSLAVFASTNALAFIAGDGKGKATADCFVGLAGYSPSDLTPFDKKGKKLAIQCTDCDPACDLDGVAEANGSCTFEIGACVNQPGIEGCTPAPLKSLKASAKAKGGTKLDLTLGGTALPLDGSSACSALIDFDVAVKSKKKGDKPGQGTVKLQAKKPTDKDTFRFRCNPRPEGEACPSVTTTTTSTTTSTTTTTCPVGPGSMTLTQVEGGSLTVAAIPAFPFPAGGTIAADLGEPDADTCVQDLTVAFPGGFSAPVFCIPALGFTTALQQTGCGVGLFDANGGSDFTVKEEGDTSDATICANTQACVTGIDSKIRVDITVGDGTADTCASGTGNAVVAIPVFTTTWVSGAGCPDPDGTFDQGTDTLIVEFPQTLDFTTDQTSATFVDFDTDGCSRAGTGPQTTGTLAGTCVDVGAGMVDTVAAGTIGSTGAPLFDLSFKTTLPNTVVFGAAQGATCATPPLIDLSQRGAATPVTATRCIE